MIKKDFFPNKFNCNVAVIGLGYVGLPLAVELGKTFTCLRTGNTLQRRIIGFDINQARINELKRGIDRTNEISKEQLKESTRLNFTYEFQSISESDVFIITVPTPIDETKRPDLNSVEKACVMVGEALKKRNKQYSCLIIFESTFYPGLTEDVCAPLIQKVSGLKYNFDFFCGYSPERINPGDQMHKIKNIIKVTSGSTKLSAQWIDEFYGSIIEAGTYKAKSIKVAESAKIIENIQRDLNIALINELSIIFNKLDVDTLDVLEAAKTKWNFLDFKPGLVGGHCIGVDPYYLTYKSELIGYYPQIVLSGRRINDGMSDWIALEIIRRLSLNGVLIKGSDVLVLGFSFKANCPDIRNTKVNDLVMKLESYKMKIDIVDPVIDIREAKNNFNLDVLPKVQENKKYNVVICAVGHKQFELISYSQWENLSSNDGIFVDFNGLIPRDLNPFRL
ncbi:nucleotide sugar dehydrogenase [Prochlorococcus marinus]|uniref:nucleotide sugar dehydrogenase n=1 Tax=Prochlorococcus marinus TaxID=1219 RepID=UPI0039AF1A11